MFAQGVDSPGGTIMKAVGLSGTQKIPVNYNIILTDLIVLSVAGG